MAPKVDKTQKRRDIALACRDLIHEIGIKNLTVAQVALTAKIGKGTVYEYFENKDDIVFEIINIHIEDYHNEFLKSIEDVKSTREKIFHFFRFVIDDSLENQKHFNGYKEYLSIVLSDDNSAMKKFNTTCHIFFNEQLKKVIEDGIKNNELLPHSMQLAEGLMIFEKGVVLLKMTQDDFEAKKSCEIFINTLFDLMEVKK